MQAAFFVGISLTASVAKVAVAESSNGELCLKDLSSSP